VKKPFSIDASLARARKHSKAEMADKYKNY